LNWPGSVYGSVVAQKDITFLPVAGKTCRSPPLVENVFSMSRINYRGRGKCLSRDFKFGVSFFE